MNIWLVLMGFYHAEQKNSYPEPQIDKFESDFQSKKEKF